MGLATHSTAGKASGRRTTTATPACRPAPAPAGFPADFDAFAAAVRGPLAPKSPLECLAVERLALAAWRLHLDSLNDADSARLGDLRPLSRDTLRAERSLETALALLQAARGLQSPRWGASPPDASPVGDAPAAAPAADEAPDYSNEWPTLPDGPRGDDRAESDDEAGADAASEADLPVRWEDRLVFDFNVSETSPVVKGTWVTVGHVVSLIVDGWSWSDVLRAHPELTEDDVRTCLAYTVEQDDQGAY